MRRDSSSNEIFGRLRDGLAANKFRLLDRESRVTAICGLINHEIAVLHEKIRGLPDKPGTIIPSPSIIEKTVTLRSGVNVTPDQLITTLLDSIVYPLDEALQASDNEPSPKIDLFDEVGLAFTVANLYRTASDYWHGCLWGDKFLEHQSSGQVLIRPENVPLARKQAVSEHRHQSQLLIGVQYCSRMWRQTLTIIAKKGMVIERGVTSFDPGRRNKFTINKLNLHRRQNAPLSIVKWVMAYEEYLQPFMWLPLPNAEQLSLETLRRIWDVLETLVDAVLRRVSDDRYGKNWFLAYVVRASRAELTDVLGRSLSLGTDTISAAIDFLTYRRRSDGLWQKPLIPLDANEFVIASAPLKHGNLLRTAERWLRQGGFDLDRRGPVFEALARKNIAGFLGESPILRDHYVAPEPVLVGSSREEIDILVRIGRLVLIGEAKCQLFPVEPIEEYRFRERLKEGAAQATRKAAAVRNSLAELQAIIGLRALDDVSVIPFVLSNHLLGSGYPIGCTPVVDLLYLGALLRQGYFRTMVVTGRDGEENPGNIIRFYTDQADAERRIPQLLSDQPVVRVYEPLISRRIRPVPLDPDGGKIFEEYYSVSLEPNPFDFDQRHG